MRMGLLGTKMRTSSHFTVTTKYLSNTKTNLCSWSGPDFNWRLGVKSFHIPLWIPCPCPLRPKHTGVPWQSFEIEQLVTLISLKTIQIGRSCSCVEWHVNVLILRKVQSLWPLITHHELDTDVKNCVHLGKSVGMDSCILLASEHSEPLWHRIS